MLKGRGNYEKGCLNKNAKNHKKGPPKLLSALSLSQVISEKDGWSFVAIIFL